MQLKDIVKVNDTQKVAERDNTNLPHCWKYRRTHQSNKKILKGDDKNGQ